MSMITARCERVPSRSGLQRNDGTLSRVHPSSRWSARPLTWAGNMMLQKYAWVAYSPTNRHGSAKSGSAPQYTSVT